MEFVTKKFDFSVAVLELYIDGLAKGFERVVCKI